MVRPILTFLSTLAFAVFTAAALVAILPWLSGRTSQAVLGNDSRLHFESLVLGVVLGILVSAFARYGWGDIPRRIVTWILIRERQFFYYALIAGCLGVLLFY